MGVVLYSRKSPADPNILQQPLHGLDESSNAEYATRSELERVWTRLLIILPTSTVMAEQY